MTIIVGHECLVLFFRVFLQKYTSDLVTPDQGNRDKVRMRMICDQCIHFVDVERRSRAVAILFFHHGDNFRGKSAMFGKSRKRSRKVACADCTVSLLRAMTRAKLSSFHLNNGRARSCRVIAFLSL